MAKIRVHQLAKEIGIDSKVIMQEAEKHGIQVKNHMSSLSDSEEFMLRAFLEELRPLIAETPPEAPAPRPAPERHERPEPSTVSEPAASPRPVTPGIVARPPGAPAASPPPQAAPPTPARQGPETRTVVAAPSVAARRPAPTGGQATPPEAPRPGTQGEQQAATPNAPPRSVEVRRPGTPVPSATATPPVRGDATPAARPRPIPRRGGEILGRREIPMHQRPGQQRPPAPGQPGQPGSGLVHTRSEGGRRTFVVTNRGRPGGPNAGGPTQAPGTQAPGRGRPGGPPTRVGYRERGERNLQKPRTVDLNASTPDTLTVELPITVKGLSEKLGVKANILIQRLFLNHKKMVKINESVDKDTVELLGLEFDCDITCTEKEDIETRLIDQIESGWSSESANVMSRPPLVSFLGHVDHGKTSLLDSIRKTTIASREHGGITQHIGASRVALPDGRIVVFLDTPGHQAFTEMRARGAQLTDVVVLVVAADDGVMPQTKEAIAHARAAKVPIVVALNKIDKHGCNPTKVRQELANEGLQDEKWGGSTQIIETSAITGQGLNELVEAVLLESEVLELTADATRPA
ncbi:MAG TPA: translation initiation factor IF-2 N-terminal domain-containing protein, partial [Planctomycetota bacterium]|nr:translation initiation factor IF-2 N-terminal domain-containing protein [Planctomycetota bacterium]